MDGTTSGGGFGGWPGRSLARRSTVIVPGRRFHAQLLEFPVQVGAFRRSVRPRAAWRVARGRTLGLERTHLYRKLKQLGVKSPTRNDNG